MSCPFFQPTEMLGADDTESCTAVIAPFVPTHAERSTFCAADRHRSCALYRHADRGLMRAVYREVARAIG
jgi:hypothetical protein